MGGVFANGLEISGKAVSAKTIAAMPDVCFTPPEAPPTPPGIPIPYPSFGMASDTDKGTGTVKIGGKTVNIKNKSHLTKTTGTEAGSAAKKGIITSKNTGKEQFNSWSNDVKFDGEPVIRNTDLATNNHASPAGNTPPWAHIASANVDGHSCKDIVAQIHPYNQRKKNCVAPQQSHHIVDNCSFTMTGARSTNLGDIIPPTGTTIEFGRQKRNLFQPDGNTHPGVGYDENKAPSICLDGQKSDPNSEHGIAHEWTEDAADSKRSADGKWTYKDARDEGAKSIQEAKGLKDWEMKCISMALDEYYGEGEDGLGCTEETELVAPPGQASASEFNDGHGNMITAYELT